MIGIGRVAKVVDRRPHFAMVKVAYDPLDCPLIVDMSSLVFECHENYEWYKAAKIAAYNMLWQGDINKGVLSVLSIKGAVCDTNVLDVAVATSIATWQALTRKDERFDWRRVYAYSRA